MSQRVVNGESVTRAELGAHLERIDNQLDSLHSKVDDLSAYVRQPQRWLGQRMTAIIDRSLILVVTAVLVYISTHS